MIFNNLDKIGVSVVIVCFNGKNRIKATLEHLAAQDGIDFDWEILVVDNNSNDGTSEFVVGIWQMLNTSIPIRLISEPNPGTMYARYTGIVYSQYRYMLYCDDDNWLPSHYVKYSFDKIKDNSQISAIGGRGELVFEDGFKTPDWIKKYSEYFGSGPQGKIDGDTTHDKGRLYTAGAIIDRVWLHRLYSSGFKSVLKGRDGKSLVAGEDTELTIALTLIGGKLYFYSEMYFKHFMPANRITWNYLKKLSRGMEQGGYILINYTNTKKHLLFYEYVITAGVIAKYFIKSFFNRFKEGDDNIIIYYRLIGKFKALSTSKSYKNSIQDNLKCFNTVNVNLK